MIDLEEIEATLAVVDALIARFGADELPLRRRVMHALFVTVFILSTQHPERVETALSLCADLAAATSACASGCKLCWRRTAAFWKGLAEREADAFVCDLAARQGLDLGRMPSRAAYLRSVGRRHCGRSSWQASDEVRARCDSTRCAMWVDLRGRYWDRPHNPTTNNRLDELSGGDGGIRRRKP